MDGFIRESWGGRNEKTHFIIDSYQPDEMLRTNQ